MTSLIAALDDVEKVHAQALHDVTSDCSLDCAYQVCAVLKRVLHNYKQAT